MLEKVIGKAGERVRAEDLIGIQRGIRKSEIPAVVDIPGAGTERRAQDLPERDGGRGGEKELFFPVQGLARGARSLFGFRPEKETESRRGCGQNEKYNRHKRKRQAESEKREIDQLKTGKKRAHAKEIDNAAVKFPAVQKYISRAQRQEKQGRRKSQNTDHDPDDSRHMGKLLVF